MFRLGTETLVVMRAPLVTSERTDTQTRDWANAVATAIKWCNVQEAGAIQAQEDDRFREFAEGLKDVWAPPRAPEILHTDRIVWDSKVYDVQGFPHLWKTLSGRKHHWHLKMVRRDDTYAMAMPSGIVVEPADPWNLVVSGEGPPPEGQIIGSHVYIDETTGNYYVWSG